MTDYIDRLRTYFAVGNVIYSKYWRSYDKVLQFDAPGIENCEYASWSVMVQECDENGIIDQSKPVRIHCTDPNI
jgi:hypothetical protein